MDTPRLMLRFRNPSPTVDTIDEHRRIIESRGSVWWGWWKKDMEELPASTIESIGDVGCTLLLIDRSTAKCWSARCVKAMLRSRKRPSAADVPRYYRRILEDIPVWFLLADIEPTDYPERLARAIGDRTLLVLDEPSREPSRFETISAPDRDMLLHLSDLHFGKDHGFRPPGPISNVFEQRKTLVDCLLADLKRCDAAARIGAIVVTGDVTTQGDWTDETMYPIVDEMKRLASELDLPTQHIVLVPGNHDIIRYAAGATGVKATIDHMKDYKHERDFRNFSDRLTGRFLRGSLNKIFDFSMLHGTLQLCALNSCSIAGFDGWTEYGYVGQGGIDTLQELESAHVARPTFRVMALHHHLLPVAKVEVANSDQAQASGVSLTIDAVKLLDAAARARVHIALHGHQHIPRIIEYRHYAPKGQTGGRSLVIASAGSASVQHARRPVSVRNTYGLLRFEQAGVHLSMRELLEDGSAGVVLQDEALALTPLMP